MLTEKIPFLELGSPRITIEVHALRSWKSHMRSYESCYTFVENNASLHLLTIYITSVANSIQ
ncbi:hypothetical protein HanPI659440_Chr17g0667581 [Helianthus annuus]|nr:hypothetical protein HanPI659440_Chr17g0667581 [Helianthus annuus]